MYCYVFVIVILCGLSRQQNDIQVQGPNNRSSQNDQHQDQNNSQNAQLQIVHNGTENSTKAIFGEDMKATYMYVGIGVAGLLILLAIQTFFFWHYKVKLRRVNEIANNLLNVANNGANDTARYSKHPIKEKTKKINHRIDDDTNEYECLADIQRPPTPPSLDSLPRKPLSVTPSPTLTSQKKEARDQNSIKNRGRIPLPHELPELGKNMNSLPTRKKPKIPLPYESMPMVTTLPSKLKSTKPTVPVLIATTAFNDPPNNELMAKLKKRAEKNALLEESNRSPIQTNTSGSQRPLKFKPKPTPPPPPVRQTHYEDPQNYDPRDSTSSDSEWTMEPLRPYNIYNI
ncbi:unnamed protein product, partial [Brenthis ino]